MSQDHRPGRVRVVSSGGPSSPSQRRRGDPPVPVVVPTGTPEIPVVRSSRGGLVRLILFLIGGAAGGVLVTWFDLIGVLAR